MLDTSKLRNVCVQAINENMGGRSSKKCFADIFGEKIGKTRDEKRHVRIAAMIPLAEGAL